MLKKNTHNNDGYTLIFVINSYNQATLGKYVATQRTLSQENTDNVSDIVPVELAGYTGFSYTTGIPTNNKYNFFIT